MKKTLATIATAGALGLGLALVGAAPANAVTISWPYTNCATGKVIKTTSYAKYSVTHRVETGGGTFLQTFSNGAAYADFDGDEINLHLPQEQQGRAEGYFIVHADHQFMVCPPPLPP